MPALAPVTVQVALLLLRVELGQVSGIGMPIVLSPLTDQVTVPVGAPTAPATVAVNMKVPPVTLPEELSLTVVVEGAVPTLAVMSEPEPPL